MLDQRPVWGMPEWVAGRLREALPRDWVLEVVRVPADGRGDGDGPSAEALDAVRGAEVYVGFGVPAPILERGKGTLRWVHSGTAGVGTSLHQEMRSADILFTNSAGVHAAPIAETVIGVMLHFARGFDFAVRAQRRGEWDPSPFEQAGTPVREFAGARVGLLGLGGIGREVAWRALALGSSVRALKRRPGGGVEGVELLAGPDALLRLLAGSDYLVVAAPETGETRGMIGRDELAALPQGAVLVNVSRGPLVDQAALARALASGRLRGAGLDVFEEEPLPAGSPLWSSPNLLITPHVAAVSRGFWQREVALMLENLSRYLNGKPLRNQVDKEAGY